MLYLRNLIIVLLSYMKYMYDVVIYRHNYHKSDTCDHSSHDALV